MNPPFSRSPAHALPPRALLAVFILHGGFALAYNAIIPLWRGPDEQSHYLYIRHLLDYRSLPRITRPHDPTGTRDERDGAIAIHPPLYYVSALPVYLLASPLGDLWRQRALRLLATAYAVGTLLLILQMMRLLFPSEVAAAGTIAAASDREMRACGEFQQTQLATANAWMQVGVVGFAALLPHFLLLSAVINNDGLFILLNTWLLLVIIRSVVSPSPLPPLMQLGFVFGLCLLTKASAVSLVPLMVLVALLHAQGETEYSLPRWIRNTALVLGPAVLIAGGWYLWYARVHGRLYFIPQDVRFGPPLRYDSMGQWLLDSERWFSVGRFLEGIARSIWSQVDWILPNDPAHPEQARSAAYPLSSLLWLAFVVPLAGALLAHVIAALQANLRKPLLGARWFRGILLAYVHFALYFAALMYSTLFIHPGGYQGGRYLLPGISGFALLMVSWYHWPLAISRSVQSRRARVLTLIWPALFIPLLVLWNVCCLWNLLGFLIPVYAH